MMTKISYNGYRFPPVIIQQAIWLYARFTLSFRDVEDLLAERGITVFYETWHPSFISKALRPSTRISSFWRCCTRPGFVLLVRFGAGRMHSGMAFHSSVRPRRILGRA
jgi:hypothetical protein